MLIHHKHKILVDPRHRGVQQDSKVVQGKHVPLMTEQARYWQLWETTLSVQTSTFFGGRRQHRSKKQEQLRNSSICFLSLLPCISQPLIQKWWHRSKRKHKATYSFFSFHSLLTYPMPKIVLVECTTIKKRSKNSWVGLCSVSIILLRIEYICICELENRNCVILIILPIN